MPPSNKFDLVGIGLNATDTLLLVNHFPAYAGKVPFESEILSPGGQVASAMVTVAKLGLHVKYIGTVGDDERGRVQIDSLRETGVNLEDLEDLRSVGLLTTATNGVRPGEVPRAGTAIQGLLALYQMMGQRAIDPGAREARAVRRADELLQPVDGVRLALDRPVLAAYCPTPFGFCLAQPLLARFTDLNTRDVEVQQSE